MKNGLAPIAG